MFKSIRAVPITHKGEPKTRLTLILVDSEGNFTELTIKQFAKHPAPFKASENLKQMFIRALKGKLPTRKEVELNTKFHRLGIKDFAEKIQLVDVRFNKTQGVISHALETN